MPSQTKIAVPLVLALVVALGCSGFRKQEETAPEASHALLGSEDLHVAATDQITAGPRISGVLDAAQAAELRAEAAGSVTELAVEIGQAVTPSQVLARIEDKTAREGHQSARSGLEAAEQDLVVAQRDLERTDALVRAGALATRDYERAESAVIAARARVEDARSRLVTATEQLDSTVVRSPFAGIVSARTVNAGDVVAPGTPLFSVIDPSSLRLAAAVPATAIGSLEVGDVVSFEVQGSKQTFEGTIERIAPAVDPTTRQIPILVAIPNPGGKLVAGLFVEGRIATERREGVIVPADAIDTTGSEPAVLRVRDGIVERVPVEIGMRDEDAETIELIKGIVAGDVLLVGAAREIEPGTPVEIRTTVKG